MESKFENLNVMKVVRFLVVGVCIIFSGVMMFALMRDQQKYEAGHAANQAEIGRLQNDISLWNPEEIDPEVAKEQMYSAATAGNKVAALQTEHLKVDTSFKLGLDKMAEFSVELDNYLKEDAREARVPWYRIQQTGSTDAAWQFTTTYSYKGARIPVLWLCRDRQNVILAYAYGIYDASEDLFEEIHWEQTTYGAERLGETLAEDKSYIPVYNAETGEVGDLQAEEDASAQPDPEGAPTEENTDYVDIYGIPDEDLIAEHGPVVQYEWSGILANTEGEQIFDENGNHLEQLTNYYEDGKFGFKLYWVDPDGNVLNEFLPTT